MLERGAQIRGRVRDKAARPSPTRALRGYADGSADAGRACRWRDGRRRTERFVLGGATAPSYRLRCSAPGFAPINQAVDAPSEGVELVLDAAGAIKGLVVDERAGPVESFDVTAQPAAGPRPHDAPAAARRARSAARAGFMLDDVPPGTYAVQVAARDSGARWSPT